MPTVSHRPQADYHVFVGGPLHGQCWTLRECVQIADRVEDYAFTYEVAKGEVSGRRAFVWRYLNN